MNKSEIILNFIKGKHNLGQMLNLLKYAIGKKKKIVKWDPIYISAFPTTECNLQCDMCLTHSTKFNNPWGQKQCKDMDLKLFKQILNRYKNALAVSIMGNGESILNNDFFKMVEYASKMKMYTYSSSNGILINENAEKIIKSTLHTYIISINGHNSAEFNKMTGMPEGLFKIICDNVVNLVNLRNLRNSNLKIMVSIILDINNYKNIKEMIHFVNELGVDGVFFFQFLPSPIKGFEPDRCLFSNNKEVINYFKEVKSSFKKSGLEIVLPPLLPDSRNNKTCKVPFYNLAVDGNGNVGGCSCQLLNFSENGKFNYMDDPWNNKYFQEFREMFLVDDLTLPWPCQWCYNNI